MYVPMCEFFDLVTLFVSQLCINCSLMISSSIIIYFEVSNGPITWLIIIVVLGGYATNVFSLYYTRLLLAKT